MRHGKAAMAGPDQRDFDRALDDRGYAETELVAEMAADRRYRPAVVVCSTATRCRQTAEAVRRLIGETIEPIFIDDLYNGPISTYLAILSGQADAGSVMLIGHNPTMEQLADLLIGTGDKDSALPDGFPTAGLAVLDLQDDKPADAENGRWSLTDFVRP